MIRFRQCLDEGQKVGQSRPIVKFHVSSQRGSHGLMTCGTNSISRWGDTLLVLGRTESPAERPTHGSLETFGGPQRHAIAHLKAGKMVIPNMSSVMLGKSVLFLKFQYFNDIRNYFFWPDSRRLPSQQTPNIWYVLVANMLESNPVVRNISEIHLRLHKLPCIPILTLHIQHGSHSPPPVASL